MDEKQIILNEKLSKRFKTGLKKYGLTLDNITNNWKYIGGEKGVHKIYWDKYYGYKESTPEHDNTCVCGHRIKNNCWISNGEDVLCIGENCVNKFIPYMMSRKCIDCGSSHRNRKDNLCKSCRKTFKRVDKECILSFS
tara:strand:- start:1561 stop:1974 length:414 start_codon:yes stop_codon:yes gene_type:complete